MPRKFIKYLDSQNIYSCKKCGCHFTSLGSLISKAFHGETGQAYLFNHVVNIKIGQAQQQLLSTGLHKIAGITCNVCQDNISIGWKYISAEESSQKYKQNRFILEKHYFRKQAWMDD